MNTTFFVVCPPGLEKVTAAELISLGPRTSDSKNLRQADLTVEKGGVTFDGDMADLYRANLSLRSANRVLMRVADFRAIGFSELRKKAARVAWEKYLKKGQAVSLRVSCHKSRLYHSAAVAERVVNAIADRMEASPVVVETMDDDGDLHQAQIILVRLLHDYCTISVDSSGELLHRRGYRQAVAKAPLRENLAAGILMASGWDQQSPLIDPFCGSGTIPIEAALLARRIPPGIKRSFAFLNWQEFDGDHWEMVRQEAIAQIQDHCPPILASDRDAGAIEMAAANAERAGVLENIRFSCGAISMIEPAGKGWVVTNPPYGTRISSNKDLRNLYAQMGNILRKKCPGWRTAILTGDPNLLRQTRLDLELTVSTYNGGIPVRLGVGVAPE